MPRSLVQARSDIYSLAGSDPEAAAAAIPGASKYLHLACEAENGVIIDIELCFNQGETAETEKVISGTITWPGTGTLCLVGIGAGEEVPPA